MQEGVRELLRFLLVGFAAGWIAAILIGRPRRARGCMTNVVIGVLGALVGGFVFKLLGISGVGSVVTATIGAIVFLVTARQLRRV